MKIFKFVFTHLDSSRAPTHSWLDAHVQIGARDLAQATQNERDQVRINYLVNRLHKKEVMPDAWKIKTLLETNTFKKN